MLKRKKKEGKTVIDLTKLMNLLQGLPLKKENVTDKDETTQIESIEINYYSHVTEVKGLPEDKKIQGVSILETELY